MTRPPPHPPLWDARVPRPPAVGCRGSQVQGQGQDSVTRQQVMDPPRAHLSSWGREWVGQKGSLLQLPRLPQRQPQIPAAYPSLTPPSTSGTVTPKNPPLGEQNSSWHRAGMYHLACRCSRDQDSTPRPSLLPTRTSASR